MGLFSFIKEIHKEQKKRKNYLTMRNEELSSLHDEDLWEAINARLLEEEKNMDVEECLNYFKGAKRIIYIVNYFDMEVQNGGLCQYFVNSSRHCAPYLLTSLNTIQAQSYKNLLQDFITKHNINLHNLDSFIIEDVDDFEKQCERYPFDDFDDAYYELYEKEPLEKIVTNYIKEHIEEFKKRKKV